MINISELPLFKAKLVIKNKPEFLQTDLCWSELIKNTEIVIKQKIKIYNLIKAIGGVQNFFLQKIILVII